jgi:hypothetical protein
MLLTCPACKQRTIFLPTVLLHVWGKWSPRHAANHFECTHCHAELVCYYSPVPFFLLGALLQILVLQSGSLSDLWMGGVIAAALAWWVFPIREAAATRFVSMVLVRRFHNPWDQGGYYIESRLLSQGAFVLVAGLVLKSLVQALPGAGAHAGGLLYLLMAGVAGLAAALVYGFSIYRIGRFSTRVRLGVDMALVIGVVWLLQHWR